MARNNRKDLRERKTAPHTRKATKKKAKESARKFADKVRRYVDGCNAPKVDLALFGEALGYGPVSNTMFASDLRLRLKSMDFLGTALESLRRENPDLEFHFWTLTHERGHTSDREPVIDLKFIRSSVDKALRQYQLSGIYVVEVQGLGNHPAKGDGRTIMVHAHAITWSPGLFDAASAENELNSSEAWSNDLGAAPVIIKPIEDRPDELDYMAFYLFKPPHDVKMKENRKRGERLRSTEKGYRPEFAARMLELLSQIELKEIVRSSLEGKAIRSLWQRRLASWNRSREKWTEGKLPLNYYDSLWERYRGKKKQKAYSRFRIIR